MLAIVMLGTSAWAGTVPSLVNVQGVLRADGGALESGVHSMRFSLYPAPEGGDAVWWETIDDVSSVGGVFSVLLGQDRPLDASLLALNPELHLGISVDGANELTPRSRLASQPFAIQAEHANNADQAIQADYATTAGNANNLGGVPAAGYQRVLSGPCAEGQFLRAIGADGTVTCVDDPVPTGSKAISVAANVIALSSDGCAAGAVWKFDGAAWQCVADADSGGDITNIVIEEGGGLDGGGEVGAIGISLMKCEADEILRYDAVNGWSCSLDIDTTYSAGPGLALEGTTFGLSTDGCVAGEVWKYNGAGWDCLPDENAGGDITSIDTEAGSGLTGGKASGAASISLMTCAAGQVLKYGATGWACAADTDTNTTYTAGAGLSLGGTTFALSTTGCVAGEVWKYDGAAWSCVPDADTTYSAGAAIALAGTAFSLSTTGCVAGEVWKYDGAAWNCVPDADSGGDITSVDTAATSGLTGGKASGAAALSLKTCTAGQILKYGGAATGWDCAADADSAAFTTTAGLTYAGGVLGLSTTGCVAGEVWKYDGATWNCVADNDTTYSAGAAITMTGTTFSLSTTGCVAGEVWKYDGATWNCVADNDTTYSAGAAITMTGTAFSLSTTGCVAGEVWKYDGAAWNCVPDADSGDITSVDTAATSGLTGGKTSGAAAISLKTCTAGQILKYGGAATGWDCAADTDTTYTAGVGINITGNIVSLSTTGCVAGEMWQYTATGWQCLGSTVGGGLEIDPAGVKLMTCAAGKVLKSTGPTWDCAADDTGTVTGGAGIAVAGGAVSLDMTTCGEGEIWKVVWSPTGLRWDCVADADSGGDIRSINTALNSGLIGGAAAGDINIALKQCPAGQVLKAKATAGEWDCAADLNSTSPTTTDGDMAYHSGGGDVRLPKGTTGQVLGMNAAGTAPAWSSALAGNPIGTVLLWGGPVETIPAGYFPCDGAILSQTEYPALFAALGSVPGPAPFDGFVIPSLVALDGIYSYIIKAE